MSMNFKEALDVRADEIERPPLPPIGIYIFAIQKMPETQEDVSDGAYDILNFQCHAVDVKKVDMEALQAFGSLKNIMIRHSFIFNKNDQTAFDQSMWGLRQFLEQSLKIDMTGKSLKQALSEVVGKSFLGTVEWKARKNDPENFDARLRHTAPVEA